MTGSGQSFDFTVQSAQITGVSGTLPVKDSQCSYKLDLAQKLASPIQNKTANLMTAEASATGVRIVSGSATFDSAQSARGAMSLATAGPRGRPGCAGTVDVAWAAARQTGSGEAALLRAEPDKTVPPDPTFDGVWEGTTAQKHKIEFTVRDGAITRMYAKGAVSGGGCSSTNSSESTFNKPGPIVDDSFAVAAGGGGFHYVVEEQFESPRASKGTLDLYFVQTAYGAPPCEGRGKTTWTAQKK